MTHRRDPLAHLRAALEVLEREGLRRGPPKPWPADALSFCSNDYLGLARTTDESGVAMGAGTSRLIAGERTAHGEVEQAFASWLGVEAGLLFTSGYAANVGALSALAGPNDVIISDALNHASLIDGARLSRAKIIITPHNDLSAIASALEQEHVGHTWVVVESYYSMEADGPDLVELRRLCDAHGAALFVDEAHAVGVLGPEGKGRCFEVKIQPDILVATLGKAFGSQGAVVLGSALLRDWLWNRARSFVFSTGLSPICAAGANRNLEHLRRNLHLIEKVQHVARRLREGLRGHHDLKVLGFGHIIPIWVGTTEQTVRLSALLAEEGFDIPPIRPPTVPSARLRLTVSARHEDADVDRLFVAFDRSLKRFRGD